MNEKDIRGKLFEVLQQEVFQGDLDLKGSRVTDLGKLIRIEGNLDLSYSRNLTSLGNLESVDGNLLLHRSGVTDLGKLTRVGGILSVYDSGVTDLSRLSSIGEMVAVYPDEEYKLPDKLPDEFRIFCGRKLLSVDEIRYHTIDGVFRFDQDRQSKYNALKQRGMLYLIDY